MSEYSAYNAYDFCSTLFDFIWFDSFESSSDKGMKGILLLFLSLELFN